MNWEAPATAQQLPNLRLASDILAAFWLRDSPNPKNFKYYFAIHVLNDETLPLIASILKSKKSKEVPHWPGLSFGIATTEAKVLLGMFISNGQSEIDR